MFWTHPRTVPVPSTWTHKEKSVIVLHIVSTETRNGIVFYRADNGQVFLATTLWSTYDVVHESVDPYTDQKAWATRYGFVWREPHEMWL